ncbi:MAG: hypothetical protein F4X11_16075 [Acidobacteria bacterium]|nr:hypothetical protein [Acidobacteriota bacterium]
MPIARQIHLTMGSIVKTINETALMYSELRQFWYETAIRFAKSGGTAVSVKQSTIISVSGS